MINSRDTERKLGEERERERNGEIYSFGEDKKEQCYHGLGSMSFIQFLFTVTGVIFEIS